MPALDTSIFRLFRVRYIPVFSPESSLKLYITSSERASPNALKIKALASTKRRFSAVNYTSNVKKKVRMCKSLIL